MLVLSQLRDTYWSAGVIYRLFERAQVMLDKSNPGGSTQVERAISSHRTGSSSNKDHDTEQQQQQCHQPHKLQPQDHTEDSMRPITEHDLLMNEQILPGALWLNSDSSDFNNVDHLLSPGFFISDNVYQPSFTDYNPGNSMVDAYDQIGTAPGVDLGYHD